MSSLPPSLPPVEGACLPSRAAQPVVSSLLTSREGVFAAPLASAEALPAPSTPSCLAALAGTHAAAGLACGRVATWELSGEGASGPVLCPALASPAAAVLPLPESLSPAAPAFLAVLSEGAGVAAVCGAEAGATVGGDGGSTVVFAAASSRPNFAAAVVARRAAGPAASAELLLDVYRAKKGAALPSVALLGTHAVAAGRAPAAAAAFDLGCRTLAVLFEDGELRAYRFGTSATLANALAAPPRLAVSRQLDGRSFAGAALAFAAPSVVLVRESRAGAAAAFWDTEYGTVLGTVDVEEPPKTKGKKKKKSGSKSEEAWKAPPAMPGRLAVSEDGRLAVLVSGGAAAAVELPEVARPTLASALGRMAATLPLLRDGGAGVAEPPLVAGAGAPADGDEEEEGGLVDAVDAAKTPAAFRARFMEYAEVLRDRRRKAGRSRKREEAEDDEAEAQQGDKRHAKRTRYALRYSQPLIERAARRCVDGDASKGKGKGGADDLREPLEMLIRSNRLSGRCAPALVERLIERRWLDLLELCFAHVHDLAEADVVRVVRFALREVASSTSSAEEHDDDHEAERFLHLALSSPRSDVLLQGALGELGSGEVLQLLRYLHKWLARYWRSSEADLRRELGGRRRRVPSLAQVVDWTSMLLDEHLAALLQTPEAHQWVREAQFLVTAQHVALCERMEGLKGALRHIKTRKSLPRSAPADYSVEWLWPLGQQ